MRLPIRKSEKLKKISDDPIFLTTGGIKKLEERINFLQSKMPTLRKEVERTQAMGDLSENAAYQEAKHELRRTESSIFNLKERLKNAVEIKKDSNDDSVHLGVVVTLEIDGKNKKYEIVGPLEADPLKGRISYVSPLGMELNGKRVGDTVSVNGFSYTIVEVE